MNKSIEVLSVSKNKFPKYEQLEVAYKNLADGKVNGKKLMSFVYPEVFKALDGAQAGVKFDIVLEKEASKSDGKEYWQWTQASVNVAGAAAAVLAKVNVSPKSNYETSDERATRQRLIVRQSSLSSAIALLKTEVRTPDMPSIPTVENVLQVAEIFTEFVFETGPKVKDLPFDINHPFANMEDDIPA